MKKILNNMYLASAVLFFLISILGFALGKSVVALIAGIVMSLFSVLFNFLFKPSWSEETRDILKNSFESLKPVGEKLPLAIIGKMSIAFIIIMFFSSLEPVVAIVFKSFPSFIFTLLYNISFAMFILGLFYNFFQGDLNNIVKMSKLFAFYNIFDIILTFILESFKVSTKGMILFLVFYSLSYLLSYMMKETDPALDIKTEVKEKKTKKDKKKNKEVNVEEVSSDELKDDLEEVSTDAE